MIRSSPRFALLAAFLIACALPHGAAASPRTQEGGSGAARYARAEGARVPKLAVTRADWRDWFFREAYPLDAISRRAVREPTKSKKRRARLVCPEFETERYRGEIVRYAKATRVNAAFRERLKDFERIVAEVATEIYGRAPHRIEHFGTYNCRTIRKRSYAYSEHAFGNAIDVSGFRFKALPRKGMGRLGRSFKVSVLKHWDADGELGARHSLFLKTLVARLYESDTFRGMIVPPAPGHANHLHLDMGRWSYLRGDIRIEK